MAAGLLNNNGGITVGVRRYRVLHLSPEDFLEKALHAFRHDEALDDIEAEEVHNELAEQRGVRRVFKLRVYTLDRLGGDLEIVAQEAEHPHHWVHISINEKDIGLVSVD